MKTYMKFLINLFNISLIKVFVIFFIIILITNILEQVEFFKNINLSFFYLVFLSFLNTPAVMFEILPFIFLLSTQVFFIQLIDKNELEIFKYRGLNNIKILKILGSYTFVVSIIFVIVFYNGSAVLKNSYLLIKNGYSNDNKYLAVITENGLWIKDEINDKINIINANKVDKEFLLDVSITKFNKNFTITEIIESRKVDITTKRWKIFNTTLLRGNSQTFLEELTMESNFDIQKIY